MDRAAIAAPQARDLVAMGGPLVGVTQTILAGEAEGVAGNCLQAAVATVLGLPLEAVPHFSQFLWWPAALELWARGRGLTVRGLSGEGVAIPDRRCVVSGVSPRGVAHSVVGEGGRVAWDPHPSRAGLETVTQVEWFETRPVGDAACWACGRRDARRPAGAPGGGRGWHA